MFTCSALVGYNDTWKRPRFTYNVAPNSLGGVDNQVDVLVCFPRIQLFALLGSVHCTLINGILLRLVDQFAVHKKCENQMKDAQYTTTSARNTPEKDAITDGIEQRGIVVRDGKVAVRGQVLVVLQGVVDVLNIGILGRGCRQHEIVQYHPVLARIDKPSLPQRRNACQ